MNTTIEPLVQKHFERLYAVFSDVVREKQFLSWITVPPWEQSLSFYRSSLAQNIPAFVAIHGDSVLDACDIHPLQGDAHPHCGQLGIFFRTARARSHRRRLGT